MKKLGVAALVAYVATVWLANYAVQHYGIVSVGFGLVAPAGVYLAGLALGLRDAVQRQLGRPAVIAAILLGAALSWFISPTLATASAAAFLCSEFADFAIYTPLEGRSLIGAVALSNTVGAAIDSALFLWLAFGSLAFFWGQFVAKSYMTLLAVAVVALWRVRQHRQEATA